MATTKWRNWATLLLILLAHTAGVLLFCKGFLLKRIEIHEHSQCRPPDQSSILHHHESFGPQATASGGCSAYPGRFKRVVWLLIDAFRYDFALYDSSLDPSPPHYRNKLTSIRDLLQGHSRHAKLFRFFADPPTTTLQRLKALTTGGLPTFIEVSSNFNSHEVLEDSLLYQVHSNGLNTTFMGDDTWLGMYEKLLTKVFPYPSFNVKDLHTVDNGIITHLVPQLKQKDASFTVAHFLGVDHCGHILGPSHPSMGDKLTQMDQMLRSVVAEMDNDTILFVFGDHGMTATGDHGGESVNETDAALFVYSPRPLFCNHQISNRIVCQIDLVPTTALLLGIPLPFSSLGAIIPELFLPCSTDSPPPHMVEQVRDGDARTVYESSITLDFLTALHLNAKQIEAYLSAYSHLSGEFSLLELRDLQRTLSQAELSHAEVATLHERQKYSGEASQLSNSAKMADTASLYVQYLQDVKEMCRQIWAKFENSAIQWGVFVVFLSTVVTFVLSLNSDVDISTNQLAVEQVRFKHVWNGLLLGLAVCVLYRVVTDPFALSHVQGWLEGVELLAAGATCGALLGVLYSTRTTLCSVCRHLVRVHSTWAWWTSNLHTLISFALAIAYALSLLGNSCILYEFSVVIFLSQTLVVLSLVFSLWFSVVHSGYDWFRSQAPIFRRGVAFLLLSPKGVVLASVFAMVVNRVSKTFRTCRDLQVDCTLTHYTLSLPAAMEMVGYLSVLRFAVTCTGMCVVPLVIAVWFSRMVGPLGRVQRIFLFFIHPLISVLVCGHWAVQGYAVLYADEPLSHWQHVLLPRVVYLLVSTSVVGNIVMILTATNQGSGGSCGLEVRQSGSTRESAPAQTGLKLRGGRPVQAVECVVLEEPPSGKRSTVKVVLGAWLQVVLGVWQVLVMLHNDGLALGAILMAAQMAALLLLTVTLWAHQEEAGVPPSTWPTAVYWCVVTSLFFHATGHETTIPSIRFDAAFVGIHGEVNSLPTFLLAGLLVGLNTLASQVFHALALPLPVLMRMLCSSKSSKCDFEKSTMQFVLQLTFCCSMKVACGLLAASIHRRHMMAWSMFVPRCMYEAVSFGVTEALVLVVWAIIM